MKMKTLFVAAVAAALLLVSPASVAWGAYADAIRADTPIGYFRMNETVASGDLVSSDSGAGAIHNAAVTEPGPVVGDWWASFASGGFEETEGAIPGDSAVYFNTRRVTAHASTVPTSSSFTMEAWFRIDPETNTGGTIMSLNEYGVLSDTFGLNVNGGVLQMHFRNGYSSANPAGTTAVDDAAWHHAAMVVTPGHASLYLDGAATPEIDVAVTQSWNGVVDTLMIGGRNQGGTNLYTGGVDEVAVYNTALTPAQIAAHYQAVPEPATLSLLALGGFVMMHRRRR